MKISLVLLLLSAAVLQGVIADGIPKRQRDLLRGGADATSGQFPYMVELRNNHGRVCQGVLIKPDVVATAGICAYSSDGTAMADANSIAFVKGTTTGSGAGATRNWQSYVVHPNYSFDSNTNNVAVIHLSNSATAETGRLNGQASNPEDGATATAVGYGTGGSTASDQMQVGSFVIQGSDICVTGFDDQLLCGTSGSVDMCSGDEGAPLVYGTDVVGLYSHGSTCSSDGGTPKFSRMSYHKSWIMSEACNYNAENCGLAGACLTALSQLANNIVGLFRGTPAAEIEP